MTNRSAITDECSDSKKLLKGDAEMVVQRFIKCALNVGSALILLSVTAVAQQIGNPTNQQGVVPPRGTFVIRNARIVTVSGADIENGSVVIRDGKIEAVGASVSSPAGAQTIEGRGLS